MFQLRWCGKWQWLLFLFYIQKWFMYMQLFIQTMFFWHNCFWLGWRQQIPYLTKLGYRVIVPSLRGCGETVKRKTRIIYNVELIDNTQKESPINSYIYIYIYIYIIGCPSRYFSIWRSNCINWFCCFTWSSWNPYSGCNWTWLGRSCCLAFYTILSRKSYWR